MVLVCWVGGMLTQRNQWSVLKLGVALLHLYAGVRFRRGVDAGKRAFESGRTSIRVEVLLQMK